RTAPHAARRPAVRNRRRSAARRRDDARPARDPLVSQTHPGTAGGDGRLFRFLEGSGPLCRGVGPVSRAGGHRRRLCGARCGRDAVSWPPRQHRARRRADIPGDPVAAGAPACRPARRPGSDAAVAGLRAIPWQFAWIQTRLLLPSWLGIDEALAGAEARGESALVREMYDGWTFFRSTLQLIAIALAGADPRIA